MDHNDYQIDDFLGDESFQNYVNGSSKPDIVYWENWLENHSEKKQTAQKAAQVISRIRFEEKQLSAESFQADLNSLVSEISALKSQKKRSLYLRLIGIAASITLLFKLGLYFYPGNSSFNAYDYYSTLSGETMEVYLADKSKVFLNESSTLKVSKNWKNEESRNVWLEGEAFFEVEKYENAGEKKFIVHSGKIEIEVKGTRFNVRNFGQEVEVILEEGEIDLTYLEKEADSTIIMQPGEKISIKKDQSPILEKDIHVQSYTIWKEDKIIIDGLSVEEGVKLICQVYGLNAIWIKDSSDIKSKNMEGVFPKNDLDFVLEALSELLERNVFIEDKSLNIE